MDLERVESVSRLAILVSSCDEFGDVDLCVCLILIFFFCVGENVVSCGYLFVCIQQVVVSEI
jgi:hypothetical protein